MVRRNLNETDCERLDEIKQVEGIDSDAEMLRVLIRDAYDEAPTDSYVYDPRGDRKTPLSTDEIQDIRWRYDAPAINPEHLMKWPRDRPDKRDVLAAICRFEGIDSRSGVVDVIAEHLGEGDKITIESGKMDQDNPTRPRNIHYYADDVLADLNDNPAELADNLPADYHLDVDADKWLSKAHELLKADAAPSAYEAHADRARRLAALLDEDEDPRTDDVLEALDELDRATEE